MSWQIDKQDLFFQLEEAESINSTAGKPGRKAVAVGLTSAELHYLALLVFDDYQLHGDDTKHLEQ